MDIYLVGGAVRDALLGLPVHERDYVVVGATPQQLIDQGFLPVGNDFPVFLHPKSKEEYALARTERKAGFGYTGFECYAAPDVSLNEDLLRRDLTINAMAQSADGALHDPYNGLADIAQKQLRHVSPAFSEDPLRVLRVARFAARFAHLGFTVASSTLALMQQMVAAGELQHLTPERVWLETRKALLTANPQVYWQVLHSVGALGAIFQAPALASEPPLITLQKIASTLQQPEHQAHILAINFAVSAYEIRQAYQQHGVPLPDIGNALKVPKKLAHLAVETEQLVRTIQRKTLTAQDILQVLKRNDAFRRPEQFQLVLQCTKLLIADLPRAAAVDVQVLTNALAKLNTIDVAQIIAAGYQQQEIGQVLQQQRLEQLEQLLLTTQP